jgi:hypothetical protein
MTQGTKETYLRLYCYTRYEQVCAIFMISRPVVEAIIAEMEAPKPVEKKPKKKHLN